MVVKIFNNATGEILVSPKVYSRYLDKQITKTQRQINKAYAKNPKTNVDDLILKRENLKSVKAGLL